MNMAVYINTMLINPVAYRKRSLHYTVRHIEILKTQTNEVSMVKVPP